MHANLSSISLSLSFSLSTTSISPVDELKISVSVRKSNKSINIVQTNYSLSSHSDTSQSSSTSTTRRQRHSIAGQMGLFKIMDIAGGFSRKMTMSTTSLFSTAVISGSSSAPNLRDMIPSTASPSGNIKFGQCQFHFLLIYICCQPSRSTSGLG